jgi:uncharacterized protein (TIGR03437 family)
MMTLLGPGIGPVSPQQPSGSSTSTILDETSILFDGTPALLLYAALNQVNAIAPFGIYGKASTQVRITQRGLTLAGLLFPVAEAPRLSSHRMGAASVREPSSIRTSR